MHKGLFFVFVLGLSVFGAGCGGVDCKTTASLSKCVLPLFNDDSKGCTGAGCHSGATPANGFDLSQNLQSLVGKKTNDNAFTLIVAGKPDESFIYTKMKINPPRGDKMPLNRTGFTSDQMDIVKRWISEGALDN